MSEVIKKRKKKGRKRLTKRKGKKVSKAKKCDSVQISTVPDDVLNKIMDGSKIHGHRYGKYEARFRRWFDWSNIAFKILTDVILIDLGMLVKDEKYEQRVIHLNEAIKKCDEIRRSIYFCHGKDLNISFDEFKHVDSERLEQLFKKGKIKGIKA